MASLREYFLTDFKQDLSTHQEWEVKDALGNLISAVTARLHLNFDANALFVSFFVPKEAAGLERTLVPRIVDILDARDKFIIQSGFSGSMQDSRNLVFTGQVYFYSEISLNDQQMEEVRKQKLAEKYVFNFRSSKYATERSKVERPLAFISHDSRDKLDIAAPLALKLIQLRTPVWYDEYALSVGDSLRESIELGLRECQRCVLILTPNFLLNGGWSKREYDTIFTRELVERRKLILPVWHNVSVGDVFKYSPILADKLAVDWTEGLDVVARRLHLAIERSYAE